MPDLTEAQARFDAARAALVELEECLAAGEPVGREERREVNDEYRAASDAIEALNSLARTAEHRTEDSTDQTVGI